jgi:uncharacterized protein (TIGR02147 family)
MVPSLTKLREIASLCKITSHEDYRSYLEAVYQAIKSQTPEYSYAHFSVSLGLSSTNAHAVIAGHRNLSNKTGLRISTALGLTESQKRYLLALIKQEHAKSTAEREDAFQERVKLARSSLPSKIDERRLNFFENWYHAAIIELLRLDDASDNAQWICENLRPGIPLPHVKQSLKLLRDLGYLVFDEAKGRLYPAEVSISTGDQVERLAILSYHRQMINLAVSAMDQIDAQERDIATITIGVSQRLREQIQHDLFAMRKKFLELAKEETKPDEILQINFQLFPISRRVKK